MAKHIESLNAHPARPSQSLADHLEGVVNNADRLIPADETTAYGDDWQTIINALAWMHDAGKLTTYFKTYLETGDRTAHDKSRPEYTYHGFVSALLTLHVLHSLGVSDEARTAGFYAVAKHHGVIPTIQSEYKNYTDSCERVKSKYEVAQGQLENIDDNASTAIDDLLTEASNGSIGWDDVFVESPEVYQNLIVPPVSLDVDFYQTVVRAWSTLVCADKLNAASISVPEEPSPRPSLPAFRRKIERLPDGRTSLEQEMNALRSRAHENAWEELLVRYEEGDRLFNIALPTGFGKTLTGLRAALELAKERDGRVIYALPYTSIIDQVDDVCQEKLNVSPGDPEYTIHHHLADTWTDLRTIREVDRLNDGSESMYAETWQSGVVLTTFTQLFESVAGPANTQSMKLPALQDSVIVVDEPQALPLDWWQLVSRLTESLIDEYDAALIQMTATQPRFLERTKNLPTPTSLTGQYDACLDFLEANPRIEFQLHESLLRHLDGEAGSALTLDAAARELDANTANGSTTLAVLNTIESAATLTEELASCISDGSTLFLADQLARFQQQDGTGQNRDDIAAKADNYLQFLAEHSDAPTDVTVIATLTTRLRPTDRAVLVAALRQILEPSHETPFDDNALITVSTQLIEAGVDVSFDRLYRDFAPLPSLVQAAGRCNREFDGATGTVTAWRLANADESGRTPSERIYGRQSLLRPTRKALNTLRSGSQTDRLSESTVISDGVEAYYDTLHEQRRTATREDSLAACVDEADGERLRKASLIDDEYETHDLLVLVTDDEVEQYQEYKHYRDEQQWQAASDVFDSLKSCIVTVPVTDDHQSAAEEKAVLPVNVSGSLEEYLIETGRGIQNIGTVLDVEW